MNGLFASGHAADLVLAVMLAEALWLVGRRGWRIADALTLLLPGAMMLVALRGALTGLDWRWIALPLILSLPVHLADIARRRIGRGAPPAEAIEPVAGSRRRSDTAHELA